MGIWSRLFGRQAEALPAPSVPVPVEAAPAAPEPSPVPAQEPVDLAQKWADELLAKQDYRALAAVNNSHDYSPLRFRECDIANRMLREAGTGAVDALLEELGADDVGKADLANVLVAIGDPRAVPPLKKFFDRGDFKAYGLTQSMVSEFVGAHPDLAGETESVACALCGAVRAVTETRYYLEDGGRKYFCADTCWDRRGSVLRSAGTATGCRFFSEGMCSAGEGGNLCSFNGDSFATGCYVYGMFG